MEHKSKTSLRVLAITTRYPELESESARLQSESTLASAKNRRSLEERSEAIEGSLSTVGNGSDKLNGSDDIGIKASS
jgi:hypothetical protein